MAKYKKGTEKSNGKFNGTSIKIISLKCKNKFEKKNTKKLVLIIVKFNESINKIINNIRYKKYSN